MWDPDNGRNVMIGWCFLDCKHGRVDGILRKLAVSFPGTQTTKKRTCQLIDFAVSANYG